MNKMWDSIWINALIASGVNGYGLIKDAAIAVKDKKIIWIGQKTDLPDSPEKLAYEIYDVENRCITPGFVDCHTHLIYAGNRAHEFEMRLQGVSYEALIKNGGGIQSTVNATRAASFDELLNESLVRARALLQSGVTTLEIKSGYGLDLENEYKILRVAKKIEELLPLTIKKTFLGAHVIPAEFKEKPDEYVNLVCHEMIPHIAKEKLADSVDVFCETIAFNLQQTEQIFKAAKAHDLQIKCHAEQLSNSSSAKLAANYHALSVDHLEYLSEESMIAMKKSGTVAVLLPGAFYFLRETKKPPIALLKQYDIPIALASDCNPGTSPVTSILLILNMACTLFNLTPEEAFQGITLNGAKALNVFANKGTLSVNKCADFAIWNISHPAELAYYVGLNPLHELIREGKKVNLTA